MLFYKCIDRVFLSPVTFEEAKITDDDDDDEKTARNCENCQFEIILY
jgi:hypothetical protein